MLDMLEHETLMTRETIAAYARKHEVCPFEFSLDAAYACDIVICDYNYIYDPRISLKRMSEERKKKRCCSWMKRIIWWTGGGRCTPPRLPRRRSWDFSGNTKR